MADVQTQAASSPAETEDVFHGETPTLEEFNHYRSSGEVPARFKPAESAASATADAPEQTADPAEDENPEHAPESDPEKAQEPPAKPISPAEKRIKQLLAEKKELERKLAAQAPTDVKPESSTAPAAQKPAQNFQEWFDKFDEQKYINEDAAAHPNLSYERLAIRAQLHVTETREQFLRAEQADQQALAAIRSKMDEVTERYPDAVDVIHSAADTIHNAPIPPGVKQLIEDSDVYLDLCYVAGGDPNELQKFIALAQKNPRAAIGKVFEYERGIREALAKNGNAETAPEKKRTQAPPPPTPVGGTSPRGFDVNDDSLSADEWFKKRNAQLEKRRA